MPPAWCCSSPVAVCQKVICDGCVVGWTDCGLRVQSTLKVPHLSCSRHGCVCTLWALSLVYAGAAPFDPASGARRAFLLAFDKSIHGDVLAVLVACATRLPVVARTLLGARLPSSDHLQSSARALVPRPFHSHPSRTPSPQLPIRPSLDVALCSSTLTAPVAAAHHLSNRSVK